MKLLNWFVLGLVLGFVAILVSSGRSALESATRCRERGTVPVETGLAEGTVCIKREAIDE